MNPTCPCRYGARSGVRFLPVWLLDNSVRCSQSGTQGDHHVNGEHHDQVFVWHDTSGLQINDQFGISENVPCCLVHLSCYRRKNRSYRMSKKIHPNRSWYQVICGLPLVGTIVRLIPHWLDLLTTNDQFCAKLIGRLSISCPFRKRQALG